MGPRRLLTLLVIVSITAAAVFGAGWKWGGKDPRSVGYERLAGWTWDAGVQPGGNGHGNDSDSNP